MAHGVGRYFLGSDAAIADFLYEQADADALEPIPPLAGCEDRCGVGKPEQGFWAVDPAGSHRADGLDGGLLGLARAHAQYRRKKVCLLLFKPMFKTTTTAKLRARVRV
jgi:hypothetical protein